MFRDKNLYIFLLVFLLLGLLLSGIGGGISLVDGEINFKVYLLRILFFTLIAVTIGAAFYLILKNIIPNFFDFFSAEYNSKDDSDDYAQDSLDSDEGDLNSLDGEDKIKSLDLSYLDDINLNETFDIEDFEEKNLKEMNINAKDVTELYADEVDEAFEDKTNNLSTAPEAAEEISDNVDEVNDKEELIPFDDKNEDITNFDYDKENVDSFDTSISFGEKKASGEVEADPENIAKVIKTIIQKDK